MFRQFVCSILIVLSSAAAFAQFPPRSLSQIQDESSDPVRGQVTAEPGTRLDHLLVEVDQVGGSGRSQKVPVSNSGYFYFDAVQGQSYVLRVTDQTSGNVIVQEAVTPGPMSSIEINLPRAEGAQPIIGTVSLYELQHKVPSKALKEGREADKYAAKVVD